MIFRVDIWRWHYPPLLASVTSAARRFADTRFRGTGFDFRLISICHARAAAVPFLPAAFAAATV